MKLDTNLPYILQHIWSLVIWGFSFGNSIFLDQLIVLFSFCASLSIFLFLNSAKNKISYVTNLYCAFFQGGMELVYLFLVACQRAILSSAGNQQVVFQS